MDDKLNFTREDSERLVRLEGKLEEQINLLQQVLEQTTKTNGRVNALEKFKNMQIGASVVISTIFTACITIAVSWFQNH